jgi:hypothetical protein
MGKQRRQTRQNRRKQTRRRRSRQRGGAVNCLAEGFTDEMIEASVGEDYANVIVGIHEFGERLPFDRLQRMGQDGIIQWWINTLEARGEIEYSDVEREALRTNEVLNTLSAFYHRFKIVIENIRRSFDYISQGAYPRLLPSPKYKTYIGPDSFQQLLTFLQGRAMSLPTLLVPLEHLVSIIKSDPDIDRKIYPIDKLVRNVQCLMFYIVKHKGQLPEGFTMDPRISEWATSPILINETITERRDIGVGALNYISLWLQLLQEVHTSLTTLPVTFGVFE